MGSAAGAAVLAFPLEGRRITGGGAGTVAIPRNRLAHSRKGRRAVAPLAMIFGGLLIVLGVAGFVLTDMAHVTALIPAFFGIALVILGVLARKDHLRMHAMHLAALLGLVGLIVPAVRAAPNVGTLFDGTADRDKAIATASQLLMALLCAVFVGLCIKSFVDARRARRQQPGA
jgi:uncharacterized membrane protein HdeD (DUF308 family)